MTNLRTIEAPTAEPLTLEEVRKTVRVSVDPNTQTHTDDDLLSRLIIAAREYAEQFLNRTLTDAVYEYRKDRFDWHTIYLPVAPIKEIISVQYRDEEGVTQTLSSATYYLDDHPTAPAIRLVAGGSWPRTDRRLSSVVITFRGAYSETDSPPRPVPESIKHAMRMMIAHWYENRESTGPSSLAELPQGPKFLMSPFRLFMGV
jgi:uncharacterized phiE125 gp8 family phage protein